LLISKDDPFLYAEAGKGSYLPEDQQACEQKYAMDASPNEYYHARHCGQVVASENHRGRDDAQARTIKRAEKKWLMNADDEKDEAPERDGKRFDTPVAKSEGAMVGYAVFIRYGKRPLPT
jgi:hypothetical protein